MKIIQSYWTKPSLKKDNLHITDRNKGGWLDRKYNYFSWALSCLTFRKFYDEVELFTDKQGAELLITKLKLPYTKVHIVLDALNKYHPDLWALGKLYTYGLQKKPFLHVDGDVYIWNNFEDVLLNGKLIAQNLEKKFNYYEETYKEVQSHFNYIPSTIVNHFNNDKNFSGINAGIIGGNDLSFIELYVRTAFDFVNKNIDVLDKINIGLFNNFYEQCLFKTMADEKNIDVMYLKTSINDRFDGLVDFTGTSSNTWYIHAVGIYKKRIETGELLENHLKKDYPNYYYKIINLLKNHAI